MIKFNNLIENLLLESHILDKIESNYVGDGVIDDKNYKDIKKVPQSLYQEMLSVADHNPGRVWFLVKAVISGWFDKTTDLQLEDLYKFQDYFKIHRKKTSEYPIRDLGQIKTDRQFFEFINTSLKLMDEEVKKKQTKQEGHITNDKIKKLESIGIEYLGISEGYQVFHIPVDLANSTEAYKTYKSIFGHSSGGAISLCTIGSEGHWKSHLVQGPIFLMWNYSDPLSPYQIHYESTPPQFKDRENRDIMG